ncbi:MAG: FKBP-type peptidyl-prolyl cis-trans isomerase [Bdellovibrionales bacterium]|nr:FKBP-type peptidyl-prolyl cis-trans isomerase [Bdellovibrionales bacterium]
MRYAILWIALPAVALLAGCNKKADLKSEKGKYSYAIGFQVAKNMKRQDIELDTVAFAEAVKDVMEGKDPKLTETEVREAIQNMTKAQIEKRKEAAEKNVKIGEDYLKENSKKEGVKTTESGLQIKITKEGDGPMPSKEDIVKVHYEGKLIDGTKFDSSYDRDQPAEFPLKAVIPGWTEGLQLMKVGSTAELTIPANLAYGERGNPSIPGNSTLIFKVELLEIVKKEAEKK